MPDSTMPRSSLSAEVVVAISFGIVMFLLALSTLLQSRKHRYASVRDEESQCHRRWPGPIGTISMRNSTFQASAPQPSFNAYTYYNVFLHGDLEPPHSVAGQSAAPAVNSYNEHLPQLPSIPPTSHLSPELIDSSPYRALQAVPACNKNLVGDSTR